MLKNFCAWCSNPFKNTPEHYRQYGNRCMACIKGTPKPVEITKDISFAKGTLEYKREYKRRWQENLRKEERKLNEKLSTLKSK